jgi:hypothetical protein
MSIFVKKRNIMLRVIFILLTTGLASGLFAQSNIQVNEASDIAQMMERFIEINQATTRVEGWRVQVVSTPDRQELERTRRVFRYKYPNISTDWVHENPWYKLYVGAFATKLEAIRLQYLLRRDYPSAYLVRDTNLRPEELVEGNY